MKNLILVKKFGPRNQQARYFAKKEQVPALRNDDLQSSLMDEQFNAQMEESMEHFMKGNLIKNSSYNIRYCFKVNAPRKWNE